MIQNDQIHAACSSTTETTNVDDGYEHGAETTTDDADGSSTAETTTLEIDEEYERGAGHQMHLLSETLKQLEGNGRLAEAAVELREALRALDDAYMAINEFDGASEEDQAANELVQEELAAINRRLDMLLSLAELKAAARRLGRAACRPEAAEGGSGVEH